MSRTVFWIAAAATAIGATTASIAVSGVFPPYVVALAASVQMGASALVAFVTMPRDDFDE